MNNFSKLSTVLATLLLVSGCSQVQDSQTWRGLNSFYDTHIDAPADINYEETIGLTDSENFLASNLIPLNQAITNFEYTFEQLSMPPADAQLQQLFNSSPWLSGIALINAEGTVTGALPEQYSKPLDFARLLETPEGMNPREIRVFVQEDPNGAEILVGRPAFTNEGELMGVFIAYFDMRNLFAHLGVDSSIYALAGNTPLWLGENNSASAALASIDFVQAASSRASDTVSTDYGSVIWLSRYLYGQPLIFATITNR